MSDGVDHGPINIKVSSFQGEASQALETLGCGVHIGHLHHCVGVQATGQHPKEGLELHHQGP